MECKNCGNDTFKVVKKIMCECCTFNHAWDVETGEYISNEKVIEEKDLCRDHVEQEGECELGNAHGEGCYVLMCSICATIGEHIPLVNL